MALSIISLPRRAGGWLFRTAQRGLRLGLLICACAGAAATPAQADFDAGWRAYQRGDFALAVAEWWPLAEDGHALAQYNMGVIYDEGGVAQGKPPKGVVDRWEITCQRILAYRFERPANLRSRPAFDRFAKRAARGASKPSQVWAAAKQLFQENASPRIRRKHLRTR